MSETTFLFSESGLQGDDLLKQEQRSSFQVTASEARFACSEGDSIWISRSQSELHLPIQTSLPINITKQNYQSVLVSSVPTPLTLALPQCNTTRHGRIFVQDIVIGECEWVTLWRRTWGFSRCSRSRVDDEMFEWFICNFFLGWRYAMLHRCGMVAWTPRPLRWETVTNGSIRLYHSLSEYEDRDEDDGLGIEFRNLLSRIGN